MIQRLNRILENPLSRKFPLAVLACSLLVGCRQEEIRVYTAPKDKPFQQEAAGHHAGDGHDHGQEPEAPQRPRPQLSWKLPEGWKEVPAGRMSVATFSIRGNGSEEAQVTITPLPMLGGRDAIIVNLWRQQVGLAPLKDEEIASQLQDVTVGGESGKLFDVTGKAADGAPARILTAMVHRSDASWFYKLSGDATVVQAQKPAFVEFLKSIQIKEAPAEAASETRKPKWNVPSGWNELPAGQMQIARFAVPDKDGAKAEVFVSVFPSDTGGTLANLNRWRRQIGLPEATSADLPGMTVPLDSSIPRAILVDMTNNSQQLIAAIVPRGSQWYFYKLMGGAAAVAPQKEAFTRFAASAPGND
jgi:hypothetical protein